MTLTDEEIVKIGESLGMCTIVSDAGYENDALWFDCDGLNFARAVIAAHDERLRQQNPPCMVANGCSTKCDDCPDAAPIPPDPDAYCVTQPDGECVSTDPRCMHQVPEPTPHNDHPLRHWDRTCPACIAEKQETFLMAADDAMTREVTK